MQVEVLITTMNAENWDILQKMNIKTDVVIANQTKECSYKEINYQGFSAKMISTNTRGLSVNRNIAINYSSGDILLFCDDDMVLPDNYEEVILRTFEANDKVNAVKFYCESAKGGRKLSFLRPKKFCKASIMNALSAGVVGLAIKKSVVMNRNYRFRENIGAGTKISLGEDSVFIKKLIDQKEGLYLSPDCIGTINQNNSTWFKGYNSDFFYSTGYVYYLLYGSFAWLAIIRRSIKMARSNDLSLKNMYKKMVAGAKYARENS